MNGNNDSKPGTGTSHSSHGHDNNTYNNSSTNISAGISSSQTFILRACRALFAHITSLQNSNSLHSTEKKTSNIPISKSKLKQPSSIPVSNSTQRRHSLSTLSKPSGVSVSISYYSLSANHDTHPNTNYQIIDILNDAAVIPLNQSLSNPEGHQEPTLTFLEVPVDSYSHLAQTLRNVPKGPLPLDVIGPTIFSAKISLKGSNHDPAYLTFVNTNNCSKHDAHALNKVLAQLSESRNLHSYTHPHRNSVSSKSSQPRTPVSAFSNSKSNNRNVPNPLSKIDYNGSALTALLKNNALTQFNSSIVFVACVSPMSASLLHSQIAADKPMRDNRRTGLVETTLQDTMNIKTALDVLEFSHTLNPLKCTKAVFSIPPTAAKNQHANFHTAKHASSFKSPVSPAKDITHEPPDQFGEHAFDTIAERSSTTAHVVSDVQSATDDDNNRRNATTTPSVGPLTTVNSHAVPDRHQHVTQDSLSSMSSGSSASGSFPVSYTTSDTYSTSFSSLPNSSQQVISTPSTYPSQYKPRKVSRPLSFLSDSTQASEGVESLGDTSSSGCFTSPNLPYSTSTSVTSILSPTNAASTANSVLNSPDFGYNLSGCYQQDKVLRLQEEIKSLQADNLKLKACHSIETKSAQETIAFQNLTLTSQAQSIKQLQAQIEEFNWKIEQYEQQLTNQRQMNQQLEQRCQLQEKQQFEKEKNHKYMAKKNCSESCVSDSNMRELEKMNKDLWELVEEYEKNMDAILKEKEQDMKRFGHPSESDSSFATINNTHTDSPDMNGPCALGNAPSPPPELPLPSMDTVIQPQSHCNLENTVGLHHFNANEENLDESNYSAAFLARRLQSSESALAAIRIELHTLRRAQKQHAKESQFLTKQYNEARLEVQSLKTENRILKKSLQAKSQGSDNDDTALNNLKLKNLENIEKLRDDLDSTTDRPDSFILAEELKKVRFSVISSDACDFESNREESESIQTCNEDNKNTTISKEKENSVAVLDDLHSDRKRSRDRKSVDFGKSKRGSKLYLSKAFNIFGDSKERTTTGEQNKTKSNNTNDFNERISMISNSSDFDLPYFLDDLSPSKSSSNCKLGEGLNSESETTRNKLAGQTIYNNNNNNDRNNNSQHQRRSRRSLIHFDKDSDTDDGWQSNSAKPSVVRASNRLSLPNQTTAEIPLPLSPESPFVPKYKLRLNPFRNSSNNSTHTDNDLVSSPADPPITDQHEKGNSGSPISNHTQSLSLKNVDENFNISEQRQQQPHKRQKSKSLAAFNLLQFGSKNGTIGSNKIV